MNAKLFLSLIPFILLFACQKDMDEMDKYETQTDTFLLVDYYEGVYKFVQIDNQYTIGVEDGLLEIPEDFIQFESEEPHSYYKVVLKLTGLGDGQNIRYQRFSSDSQYFLVKQVSQYNTLICCVERVPFLNDYFYYIHE